jgi:probable rRNA maturation factor
MTRATRRAKVSVVVLDAGWTTALPGVERLVRQAAQAAISGVESLTVALADDKRVRALNKRDRKQDKPTNVLSYPSGERGFLGDVVLARQTVWHEAKAQNKSVADHVAHLVVHGALHLRGYDHETNDKDADHMEALERRILKRLGVADPYQ